MGLHKDAAVATPRVAVGYINADQQHALISINHPTIVNRHSGDDFAQVVITIEAAADLRNKLTAFLEAHGHRPAKKDVGHGRE